MTFPKVKVKEPACLHGVENGKIPDSLLVNTPGQDGGAVVRLVAPAARAWKALCAAALAAGHVLQATSAMDSFRPYAVQETIFRERYTTTHLPGRPSRVWNGKTYWQKPGTAAAAVPGTSKHGKGLAVDTREKSGALTKPALDWLLDNAQLYGWSWELDSEPWHLHYFAGDNTPAAVLASEHPVHQGEDDMTEAEKQQFAAAIIEGTTRAVLAALADDEHQVVADRIKKAAHAAQATADHFGLK